uniref:Uncharacterized protein n=1 Tax=Anguilla anguilla TaxID=7936 RepID=A0A0E9PX30_ANGAN
MKCYPSKFPTGIGSLFLWKTNLEP